LAYYTGFKVNSGEYKVMGTFRVWHPRGPEKTEVWS
jgi:predicted NodU family carbamoyl transferase